MKKITTLLIILVMALVLSGCGSKEDVPVCFSNEKLVDNECVVSFTNITNSRLETMLLSPNDYQFLDVRTVQEYNGSHVPGFDHNLDFYKFENNFSLITGLDKDKPVVIMCNSGNRSVSASNILHDLGYTEIYNLRDGIKGWTGATE